MKFVRHLIALSLLTFSVSSFSDNSATNDRKQIASVETPSLDTVLDIPLRLGGLVTTLVGTGLFIGTSPITGLMTAIRPHNAIQKTADYLVVRPSVFTFVRPTGDFYYDSRPDDEK
ncbi:MAG: hypothetical protein RIT35_855 [Pseudomonadota bacterium]